MSGLGHYLSDPTAGITRPADLPPATIIRRSRNFQHQSCPYCGKRCDRHDPCTRVLHDVGDVVDGRPRDIHLEYSQHRCTKGRRSFTTDMSDYAWPKAPYTHRVVALAVRLVIEDGLPYQAASWHLWRDPRVFVPLATIQNWVEAGGKRVARQMWTSYLDWSLGDFSGYIAIDELYDGPFCVLSIVDNHTFKRLLYQVLDHNPEHPDITAFLRRFQMALRLRGLALRGVTTDASPLYPEPLQAVFGEVPHQICEFHILKELTKAILQAVATVRKDLAARKPRLKRGRPSTPAAKRAVRQGEQLQQKIGELFGHRYLFVQHSLTPAERRTLQRLTRGLPQLRTLRTVMEEVYGLFDRRCRPDTALAKLAKLRQRVRRFKLIGKLVNKLHSPNLDKALMFLDDKLLPATSNAVERGNRRHRKMQKTIYRVRTQEHISNRIALDMLRDWQKAGRCTMLQVLHETRTT
jgi:transposase